CTYDLIVQIEILQIRPCDLENNFQMPLNLNSPSPFNSISQKYRQPLMFILFYKTLPLFWIHTYIYVQKLDNHCGKSPQKSNLKCDRMRITHDLMKRWRKKKAGRCVMIIVTGTLHPQ